MTLPHPRTVRARLTLFTMLVTGVLLGLIILVVDFGARRTLLGAVDGELLRQARGMANGPGGPGDRRRPPPIGDDGNPGREDRRPLENRLPGTMVNRTPTTDEVHPLDFPSDESEGGRPNHPPAYDARAILKAKNGVASFSEFDRSGKLYRLYTFPIRREGEIVRVSQIPSELTNVYVSLDGLRRTLLQVVLPIGVLLAGLASLLLVDRFMRPLRRISGDADRIGATDLAARLPVVGEDEFAGLSTTLNGMLTRLELAFRKERHELERQRQFTADASHELKTPLAVIKANAGLMLHVSGTAEETREWAGEIDAATVRMTTLVNDMLVLARAEAGNTIQPDSRFDLRDAALGARRALGVGEDRLIVCLPERPVNVLGSSGDLTRVIVNLVGNALKHAGSQEPVELVVAVEVDRAIMTVTDHGKGIAPEHLFHLFDRFYRVDASRSSETGGTGLGLAIARGIIETHGGTIGVESKVGRGTTFTVSLPIAV